MSNNSGDTLKNVSEIALDMDVVPSVLDEKLTQETYFSKDLKVETQINFNLPRITKIARAIQSGPESYAKHVLFEDTSSGDSSSSDYCLRKVSNRTAAVPPKRVCIREDSPRPEMKFRKLKSIWTNNPQSAIHPLPPETCNTSDDITNIEVLNSDSNITSIKKKNHHRQGRITSKTKLMFNKIKLLFNIGSTKRSRVHPLCESNSVETKTKPFDSTDCGGSHDTNAPTTDETCNVIRNISSVVFKGQRALETLSSFDFNIEENLSYKNLLKRCEGYNSPGNSDIIFHDEEKKQRRPQSVTLEYYNSERLAPLLETEEEFSIPGINNLNLNYSEKSDFDSDEYYSTNCFLRFFRSLELFFMKYINRP